MGFSSKYLLYNLDCNVDKYQCGSCTNLLSFTISNYRVSSGGFGCRSLFYKENHIQYEYTYPSSPDACQILSSCSSTNKYFQYNRK